MPDVTDRVADATTTLICGPTSGTDTHDSCTEFLTAGVAEGHEVLWVSYTRPPEACVETLPDDVPIHGVLAVGDAPHGESHPADGTVEVVATPADTTALGIKLSRLLSDADGDLVVCFDSVTAMCQYVEPEAAYGFLHTVAAQLYDVDARAHFHLDPAAHDGATVDLFASLCDAVVDLRDDERTVRTRPSVE